MKTLFCLFVLVAGMAIGQNYQVGFYYGMDFPNKEIMPKMGIVAGAGTSFAFRPISHIPVYLEGKGTLGSYSYKTLPQTYTFTDGTETRVNVNYSSSFHRALFGTKIQIGNEYKRINAFITPQIGGAFFNSRIYIEDPTVEEGECRALESRIPHRDRVGVYGGELGFQVNLSGLKSGSITDFKHRLNFSFNFLAGFKPVDYINVRYMTDDTHGVLDGNTHTSDGDRILHASFINMTSNVTHEHKIAELYRTRLQMWGFNVGYVFMF
jgi:hypothetical protein